MALFLTSSKTVLILRLGIFVCYICCTYTVFWPMYNIISPPEKGVVRIRQCCSISGSKTSNILFKDYSPRKVTNNGQISDSCGRKNRLHCLPRACANACVGDRMH